MSSVLDDATLADTLALVKVESRPPPSDVEKPTGEGPKATFLARLIEHRVRDGETLESVAERYETLRVKQAYEPGAFLFSA